jgi:hypothetical protein
VAFHPVAQVLAERGTRKGVSAGAENGDKQRGRCDLAGTLVVDRDGVARDCGIVLTFRPPSQCTTVGALGSAARYRWYDG